MQDKKRFDHTMTLRLICWLLLSSCISVVQAQIMVLDNYTVKNGLPQNTVYDIDQDQDGYIWFATQVGAARFDGYSFEYYTSSNGLPNDNVNCLLVDTKGSIWFGTEGGIAVYDGVSFKIYDTSTGLVDNRVDGMIEDMNGNIWAWTDYGLSVIKGDIIVSHTKDSALTDNSILDVLVDSKGRVHVATFPKAGLTLFNDPFSFEKIPQEELIRDIIEVSTGEIWYATQGKGIFVKSDDEDYKLGNKDGLTDDIVLSLMEDHAGNIWCGTYADGMFIYKDGTFSSVSTNFSSQPIAEEIYEDRQGRVWIKDFSDGVWFFDEGEFKHIREVNGLINNDVLDIFEDKYGSIWMATLGGASKYGKGIFEIYNTEFNPLLPDQITSVFVDSKERIWFGSYMSLLYMREQDTNIMGKGIFPDDATPLSFAEDKYNNIYIGTDVELLRFDGGSIDSVYLGKKRKDISINSLLYTDDEKLWCATDSGVYIYENDEYKILGKNEGLVHSQVNSLLQMDQMICCATEGGISIFDQSGKHIRDYTKKDGLDSDVCIDVTQDLEGNLWVATDSKGISMIPANNTDSIVSFNTSVGLISNSTYFVEFSDSISLWIGTNRGINVLNTLTGEIAYYGQEEGFYPLEASARAFSRGSEGDLWIGTGEGLVHYMPKYDVKQLMPPDLILYPPIIDGVEYSGIEDDGVLDKDGFPEEPRIPYNKNSLSFRFTGIHTTVPSNNRFSYYLEGFDKGWSVPGADRSIPYMRLPNGHYIFRVKAYNSDGVEGENEASFAFTIKPPFWKAIWFIIFEILAVFALIFGIIKYRERQLIREKRILEVKVKERTREIEDQKIEIEAQRDEISEQKNFVENQRDQIAIQNKDITDSIQYASRIQHAVLPGKRTLEQTLPEHFILFKPRDIVSGDFYWVEQKEEQVIVCAADCTGHGVPGAFMSLLGLTFLNEIVNKDGILKASEILNRLRTYIIKSLSHKDETSEARDGMDVSLVVIDRQLNMLEYAGAYNSLVLYRKGEMIEIKADKMPVGKHMGEEGPFTNHKIQLEDEDMIYLYSDGFPDQFGGEKDSKYKARPFKRLLNLISSEPVDTQADLLEKELDTWMGGNEQVDDILVMGIRYLK